MRENSPSHRESCFPSLSRAFHWRRLGCAGIMFPGTRMHPRKTDLARQALQSHAAPLGMRDRQVLILCDGNRGVDELAALLGPGTEAQIQRLCAAGYLTAAGTFVAPVAMPPAEKTPPASHASIPVEPRAPATSARRSIAAAKLYMIGMLELQRHESAASHKMRLQACQDPDATAAHLIAAVHCLQRTTSSSFTQRVRERLAEVMPEPYLPALEKLDLTISQSASR